MNFTIYHIKPDWLRRVILVVAFVPVAAMSSLCTAAVAAYEDFTDMMKYACDCWNAED